MQDAAQLAQVALRGHGVPLLQGGCCRALQAVTGRLRGGSTWGRRGLQCHGQLGALPDGAFGVEFGGLVRATNQMHAAAGCHQLGLQFALRVLSGAHHDGVGGNGYLLVSHGDVQAGVVDQSVSDTVEHLDVAVFERGAVNPAGGLAQAIAHFAGFTLQQINFARALVDVRRSQAAARAVSGVHAPFGKKLGRVQAGAHPLMQQVLGRVKANATRANQRHGLADSAFVAQHIQVAHHLGVLDAVNLGQAGRDPGGQHDVGKAALSQLGGGDAVVQHQLDLVQFQLAAKKAQRLVKLLFARHLLGDVELATNLCGCVKQGHFKPALGGGGGKRQTGRARAYHGNAAPGLGGHDVEQGLVAGARVHQAGGDLAAKGVVQTGLVAANAGVDLVGLACSGLLNEEWVSQKRPRHRDHVAKAFCQKLLRHLGGVDAVGGHQRNAHLAHELLGDPRKRGARHLGGNGGNTRLVPADAGVDEGGSGCLYGLGELNHLVLRGAAFNQVEHREAVNDDEVGAHPFARAAHDFHRETNAVLVAAAPFIVALVGASGYEFVEQVAFGAHDFHTVVAGRLRQRGAVHKVGDGLAHLLGAQRVGTKGVDGRLQGAGRDQVRVVSVAAKVENLHGDFAARLVHRVGHHLMVLGLFWRGHASAAGHGAARIVGGNAAGHDQAHAACGALGIKRRHALETVLGFFKTHVHGAHDHPVAQGGKAQIKGLEQVGVSRHEMKILKESGR